MARNYARFESALVGDGQVVTSGGMEVVSAGDVLTGHARADINGQCGVAGAEFVFYSGLGDVDYQGVVGLVDDTHAPSVVPGGVAGSVGWHVAAGELWAGGVRIATALELPPLQTILGMSLDESVVPARVRFYVQARLAVYADLHASGITSDGVWLGDDDYFALVTDTGEALRLE